MVKTIVSVEWNDKKGKNFTADLGTEKALLVAIVGHKSRETTAEYLDELEFLALTAGAQTIARVIQPLQVPNSKHYVGTGKLEEIKEIVETKEISLVICDDDLSAKQTQILEKELKVKIIDRSALILDIFARRAQTAQAKAQVELAQMEYLLPRLRGLWTHLERQRGGIGMRGPGEKEIETDRRIVRDQISKLKKQLEKIERQGQIQRKSRQNMVRLSLVGYTNAGKSTIMSAMSKSDVFVENRLFATLDTTVRKVVIERMPFLLSDTVGFIRKLPHHLVESFKSTLSEAKESDILIHVIDVSHPQKDDHIATVLKTLKSLGIEDKPMILVFNKYDQYLEQTKDELLTDEEQSQIEGKYQNTLRKKWGYPCIFMSALNKDDIARLKIELKPYVEKAYTEIYPHRYKAW